MTLDLSSQSDAFDSAFIPGGWLRPTSRDELAREAVDNGAALVVTRFGQPRLSRAQPLSQDSPDVVPTGISLWPAADTRAVAPWDGEVVDGDAHSVTVRGSAYELTLSGVTPFAAPGDRLRAGDGLADMASGRWAEVARAARRCAARAAADHRGTRREAGWRSAVTRARCWVFPHVAESHRDDDLLARRDESFAQVQEHYYAKPPQIERGWRHFLMSTDGPVLPRHGQQRHGSRATPIRGSPKPRHVSCAG